MITSEQLNRKPLSKKRSDTHAGHGDVLAEAQKQLAEILKNSKQSIYIYMDDINKACNERFSTLLGYESPEQWAAVKENFPEIFVAAKDRRTLISAYQSAMTNLVASTISVNWRKKNGGEVPTSTMLVPMIVERHKMALHFITPA